MNHIVRLLNIPAGKSEVELREELVAHSILFHSLHMVEESTTSYAIVHFESAGDANTFCKLFHKMRKNVVIYKPLPEIVSEDETDANK